MSRLPLFLSLAGLALLPPGDASAVEILRLDPEHTEVSFHLGATGHDVEGHLYLRDGEVRLDPATHRAEGAIVLDSRRTDSGNEKRDRKMHEEVLASVSHPWIVFRPEAFEGDPERDGTLKLQGNVELLGVEHPVVLETRIHHDGDSFEATGELPVPFVSWGLEDPSILFLRVDKVVEVEVSARGSWTHEDRRSVAGPDAREGEAREGATAGGLER